MSQLARLLHDLIEHAAPAAARGELHDRAEAAVAELGAIDGPAAPAAPPAAPAFTVPKAAGDGAKALQPRRVPR